MQVKCPKCRLRFEALAAAGVNELQCNCPRCGTPFTYLVEEDAEEAEAEETASAAETETEAREPSSPIAGEPQASTEAVSSPSADTNESPDMSAPQSATPHEPRHHDTYLMHQQEGHRRGGAVKSGALRLVAIVAALVLAYFVVTAGVDKIMTSMDDGAYMPSGIVEEPDTTAKGDSAKAATGTTKKVVATVDVTNKERHTSQPKAEDREETVPAWLQGRWEVNGGETDLTFRITAKAITVSDAFHTSHGSASYRDGRLVCRLRNGRTFVYTADRHRRRIIAGDGTVMTPM